MLRLIVLLLATSATLIIQAARSQEGPRPITPYTEQFSRQFAFYPGGKVVVTAAVAGSLRVIAWKQASVRVEAEKILYQPPGDDAKRLAAQFPISVRHTQTTVTVQFKAPAVPGAAVEVNGIIYVPEARTDVHIRVSKGDCTIEGVTGWIEVTLEDGNLEARGIQGYFSGLIKSGDITIEPAGRRWEGHGLTAATLRGAVLLRLPEAYSAALQLETKDGNLEIDYPEQEIEGEKVPLTAVANKAGRSLKASVGDGGAPLRLSTRVGDIRLSVAR